MRAHGPAPGEEVNLGEPTVPREAASAIVLRDSSAGPEVLLVQRNPAARFMGGAWVFPGGAVHPEDGGPAGAAVRELEEEAGIVLPDPSALVPYSRWITPRRVKVRFDTWFFVASAPAGAEARCDGAECVAHRWVRPADALAAGERGELMLVFPTIKHLEQLARPASVADALAEAREREIEPIEPRFHDGRRVIVLPGEPGFDEAR
jgi:8-oxo-dGTP pyrophosphatase MutT (NUDIX family)